MDNPPSGQLHSILMIRNEREQNGKVENFAVLRVYPSHDSLIDLVCAYFWTQGRYKG